MDDWTRHIGILYGRTIGLFDVLKIFLFRKKKRNIKKQSKDYLFL